MKTVLVTGASGFIGTHLCRRLSADGYRVFGTSRDVHDADHTSYCQWRRADLGEFEQVRGVVREVRPDVVFHLASRVSGARALEEVLPTFRSNLASTVNLLVSLKEFGCERLIIAGSSEEPLVAGVTPCSPYAVAKLSSTSYASMFNSVYGLPVVAPRIFMTYGPDQNDETKIIPYTICSLLREERPRLSSGRRLVDWIYVEDVVEGLVRTAFAPKVDVLTFDLGSGVLVSIRSIVEQITSLIDSQAQPNFGALPDRAMEPERVADTSFLRRSFGWLPSTSLAVGLKRTIDWYRARTREIVYPVLAWLVSSLALDQLPNCDFLALV